MELNDNNERTVTRLNGISYIGDCETKRGKA